MPVLVRPGRTADASAVGAIRNDAIEHTTAVWTSITQTPGETAAWWGELLGREAAYVAEVGSDEGGTVVGYACWAQWRAKEGYRHTVESSVYVANGWQGAGIGRRLMTALITGAREAGAHVMLADIESGNTASIALHAALGFETAGVLREIGTKFGRWLDLTIMRLPL